MEEHIVEEAVDRLLGVLNQVPFLNVSKPMIEERLEGELFPMDAYIKVQQGGEKWWLCIEVKQNAQLRDARHVIEPMLDRLVRFSSAVGAPAYPIFVSQYLTQSIRDLCVEKKVGYLDFSGNCRLVFDYVFIEREVPLTETPERKRLRTLFSPKASRVVRRLLHYPSHPWKVQKLAEDAMVSAATVSLIKDKLLGDEYATRQGEAFIVTQPERLLSDWTRHYDDFARCKALDCYGQGELDDLEARFADFCKQQSIEYAFTLFSGARRVAPFTRGVQRAYAYVSREVELLKLAEALDLKPVDSGGNFKLLMPIDDDIFYEKQVAAEAFVVSDIQLYLDLSRNQGRGEENAEYLLETRIRRRW